MRPSLYCHLVNGPCGDPVLYVDILFERRALLFDIGDVASLTPRKLLRVSDVFVSHTHMDHFAGFDRLLRLLLGRDRTVRLHGPAGFIDQVGHKLHAYTWNVIGRYAGNLVFDVVEVREGAPLARARFQSRHAFAREPLADPDADRSWQAGVLATCGSLLVRCAVLDHGTPCLGFAVAEPAHINVWKTRLAALGLAPGPWLRNLKQAVRDGAPDATVVAALRRGADGSAIPVTLTLGALRGLAQVVAGQTLAYVVDVRPHAVNQARIALLASSADLLVIECPFLDADAAQAAHKNHLTAAQAGALARHAGARRLLPCHFSARYADRGARLEAEAQHAFRGPDGTPPGDARSAADLTPSADTPPPR